MTNDDLSVDIIIATFVGASKVPLFHFLFPTN
jgi:hypothetical protein